MAQFDPKIRQPWIVSFFLLFSIITVNSELVLNSLQFRTKDLTRGSSDTPAVNMTLWLDSIIYQCVYTGESSTNGMAIINFPSDTLFVCDNGECCQEIGTFECADYLNGQLLVENDDTDSIIIEEIILSVSDATESIEYGISRWCVNTDATGWGRFYTRDRDDIRSDVEPNPCVNESPLDTNYDSICVDNDENCSPSRQLMSFNLDSENAHAVNALLMDGTNTTVESITCEPTTYPTAYPTMDPIDSSDSSDGDSDSGSSSFENAFISENKEMNYENSIGSDNDKHSLTIDISDTTLWNLWLMCIVVILVSVGVYCCVYIRRKK